MPIIKKGEAEPHIKFAIWEIVEREEELLSILGSSIADETPLTDIKVESRRMESLAARCALRSLLEPLGKFEIYKDQFGKPHLRDESIGLSISHAKGFAAAAINLNGPIGIDIEHEREQVIKIAHKFVHSTERVWVEQDIHKLTQVWSAKEALYKLHGRTQLAFAEQLITKNLHEPHGEGRIIEKKEGVSLYKLYQPADTPIITVLAY
ncbi:4'-phosphopantetheinyl transferase family protein [Roseivirga sp.]|uniref:4'-phosphopantetheinyl transferase family protein n=1 Tax=Roseivirga sp. TaxID=1964215 RepID=UPI003B51FA08